MDETFALYAKWIPAMQDHFARRYPKSPADSEGVHRAAIRAKALDTLRGMLPAATQSNVGHLRNRARRSRRCCCGCARIRWPRRVHCADAMLEELRKVIPAFLTRVDMPDRGGRWSEYLAPHPQRHRRDCRGRCSMASAAGEREEVVLSDFDPDGEIKIVAAALYAVSDLPDDAAPRQPRGG